jgi:hypothetical protein
MALLGQPEVREADDSGDQVPIDLEHHEAVWPVRTGRNYHNGLPHGRSLVRRMRVVRPEIDRKP